MARAALYELREGENRPREEVYDQILPLLLHGDAAFAGQGVVIAIRN